LRFADVSSRASTSALQTAAVHGEKTMTATLARQRQLVSRGFDVGGAGATRQVVEITQIVSGFLRS
jgi:hypothetical protein